MTMQANIITLHRSAWAGSNASEHPDRIDCEPREQPRHHTGIHYADVHGDSVPVDVLAPAGWHIAESNATDMQLYDADEHAVTLWINEHGHIMATGADRTVRLRERAAQTQVIA